MTAPRQGPRPGATGYDGQTSRPPRYASLVHLDDPHTMIDFGWLLRLRWLVAAGHWLLVGCTVLLGADVSWALVVAVVVVGTGSNLILQRAWPPGSVPPPTVAVALMVLDIALLTGLLAATGGASNPFTFLYLFQLVLAAMVLDPRWVWPLVGLEAASYAALFWLTPAGHHASHADMDNHLVGMWLAFAVAGPFAALVVTRIRAALAEANARLQEAQELQERTARLTALGTLAAGAAHELASPLSVIAVVGGDLRRSTDADVAMDGDTIAAQVQRCRAVLDQLSADGGQVRGAAPDPVSGSDLVACILEGIPRDRIHLEVDPAAEIRTTTVPVDLVAQAVRRLIDNALSASGPDQRVTLRLYPHEDSLRIEIVDLGEGMPPQVLRRATEPFFTTRQPGEGMGLGLHFTRTIAEQLGGRLHLRSEVGRGTVASLDLPGDPA